VTNTGLLNLVLGLALAIMIGWLLYVGQAIMIPVVIALIAAYVLLAATDALSRLPVLSALPRIVLGGLVLAVFTLLLFAFAIVVVTTTRALIANAPQYEAQVESTVLSVADQVGIHSLHSWEDVRRATLEQLDFQSILISLLGSVSNLGAMLFIVTVYAAFLMSERGQVVTRIHAALPEGDRADWALKVVNDINKRVAEYLAVKTLINIILGAGSYAILLIMEIDFALFWALMIGLMNYIPYVGSLLGVLLPVFLSVAQFGSLQVTLILAGLLTSVQVFVGNVLEPRLIGHQLNLSPFVVLLALSVWSALWGLPGAILAIPLTSVLVIIFESIEQTRFISILLAQRPPQNEETERSL
jgi:predicted PurR-regulated permease PerM